MKRLACLLPAGLILLVLVLVGVTGAARAQDTESRLESSIDYSFGKELRFLLNVEDAADVKKITLSFRPELSNDIYVVNVPFEPAESLSITHHIEIDMIDLAPYSPVIYSWLVETDEEPLVIPEQRFNYDDNRYAWQQMTREGATAHWTGGGPSFGDDILDVVDGALSQLTIVLPLETINPFDVYVYPSSGDLRAGVKSAGLDSEETIISSRGPILVKAVNPQSAVSDLGQSIPYELAHLLMYQAAGENHDVYPWWLAEGLGLIFQSRPNPRSAEIAGEAVQTDSTIPLGELCVKPMETGDRAELASAQSLSLVSFIKGRFGNQKLEELVHSYALGSDCETGVKNVLGMTLEQLEDAWLDAHQTPPAPVRLFGEFGFWILLIFAGFGLALMLVRFSTGGKI